MVLSLSALKISVSVLPEIKDISTDMIEHDSDNE